MFVRPLKHEYPDDLIDFINKDVGGIYSSYFDMDEYFKDAEELKHHLGAYNFTVSLEEAKELFTYYHDLYNLIEEEDRERECEERHRYSEDLQLASRLNHM